MYRIIVVCLVLFITACGEADKVPKGVLSKEKMRDVLLDMNLADSYSSLDGEGNATNNDSLRQVRVKLYYRQILDLHKLTPAEFKRSYSFYEAHPDKFKDVYDMMFASISNDKNMLDLNLRREEYLKNTRSLLPVNNNSLISGEQDTLIPFVKKNKRGINFNSLPPKAGKQDKPAALAKPAGQDRPTTLGRSGTQDKPASLVRPALLPKLKKPS